VDVGEIDNLLAYLRSLDDRRVYGDLDEIERLRTELIQGLKEFEYALRREVVGPQDERLFLSGSEEVPPGYREMVEEYYRNLSRTRDGANRRP
jgi:hypothetical protein